MKTIVICGIDSVGKTTCISHLPWKNTIKYPNNEEIKNQINTLYKFLIEGGKELNKEGTVRNIYRQIHDLYDRDFRLPMINLIHNNVPASSSTGQKQEQVIIFDRYFIDNVVYSRMNGVEKEEYSDDHHFIPDLVIMIKARNYKTWKEKFVLKGDENIREPAILFNEVQDEMQRILKELKAKKKIKNYTIVEGLSEKTTQEVMNAINELLISPPVPSSFVSS